MAKIIGFKGLTQRVEKLESASGNSGGGSSSLFVDGRFEINFVTPYIERNLSDNTAKISFTVGTPKIDNLISGGLHFFGDEARIENLDNTNVISGDNLTLEGEVHLEGKMIHTTGQLTIEASPGSYLKDCVVVSHGLSSNVDYYGGVVINFGKMGYGFNSVQDGTLVVQMREFGEYPNPENALAITWPNTTNFYGNVRCGERFNLRDYSGRYIVRDGYLDLSFLDEILDRLSILEQKREPVI